MTYKLPPSIMPVASFLTKQICSVWIMFKYSKKPQVKKAKPINAESPKTNLGAKTFVVGVFSKRFVAETILMPEGNPLTVPEI